MVYEVEHFSIYHGENRVVPCRLISASESTATVEIEDPVRKRIRVPIEFLCEIWEEGDEPEEDEI